MAPLGIESFHGSSALTKRVEWDGGHQKYQSTPTAAVIVPVVTFVALVFISISISYYRYCKRQAIQEQSVKPAKGSRKIIPNWLSSWFGMVQTRLKGRRSTGGSETFETSGNMVLKTKPLDSRTDADSDSVIEVDLGLPCLPQTQIAHARGAAPHLKPKTTRLPLEARM